MMTERRGDLIIKKEKLQPHLNRKKISQELDKIKILLYDKVLFEIIIGNMRIINGEPEKDVESLLATLRSIAEENKRERISSLMLNFFDAEEAQASTGETGDLGIHDWQRELLAVVHDSKSAESDTSTTEVTELPHDTNEGNDAKIEKITRFREQLERELSQLDSKILNMDPELQRYLQDLAFRVVASMFGENIWDESFQRIKKVDGFIGDNNISDPEADRIQLLDTIEEIRTLALSLDPKNQKKIKAMLFINIAEGFAENKEEIPPEILLRIGEAGRKGLEVIRAAKKQVDKDSRSPEIQEKIDKLKNGVIATSVGDTVSQHPRIAERRRATAEERVERVERELCEDLNKSQTPLYEKLCSIFTLDELVLAIFGNIQSLTSQ